MNPILFYTEIYPFRDSYTQHSAVGTTFLRMARTIRSLGGEAFVLANNELADLLLANDPASALVLIRCTGTEDSALRALYRPWDAAGIADWVALAKGEGPAADLVAAVLGRVHQQVRFSTVVSWSDNGGVRAFCRKAGLRRLHLELGPTRAPFPETVYFDSEGTNALARFRGFPAVPDADASRPDRRFWLANWFKDNNSSKEPGPVDGALTWRRIPPPLAPAWDRRLCYIPLQLADDLNLHLGSQFRSPAEFLAAVVPQARARGYLPVVKPHPKADSRPFNLMAQAEALRALRKLGPESCILLAADDVESGNWLLANAALVVTINSSVGFEAALFGTPVVLAGEAAYDFRSLPRLGACDLGRAAADPGGPVLDGVVSRMLCEILYPSGVLKTRRFARALMAAHSDQDRLPLDEGLRRHLGPAQGFNVDPAAMTGDDLESPDGHAGPHDLGWFEGKPVTVEQGSVSIGAMALTQRKNLLVGKAAAKPQPVAETDHQSGADDSTNKVVYRVRGYTYRSGDKTAAAGILCLLHDKVIAAHPAKLPRMDLEHKRLPSYNVGFEFDLSLAPGTDIDKVRLLPFDALRDASLWTLTGGTAQVAGV